MDKDSIKQWRRLYEKSPKVVAYRKAYKARPERKDRELELRERPAHKKRVRAYYARPAVRERIRVQERAKRSSSVQLRVHSAMSCRIHEFVRKERISWTLTLGYRAPELMRHLEKQFSKGMSWENYGRGWHIDHIVPATAFCFSSTEDLDFKACWALSNLRPCWASENIKKRDHRQFLI